ncbi:serine/threonine protein kinase [Cylindrospermum sp. NIES-4074]|nr:serine/threonine protein kinase [Cylindrospermum sp. NIES-4074]
MRPEAILCQDKLVETDTTSIMLGKLLDRRYKIVQVLSAGGFGETYIAEDMRRIGNPRCVVKRLQPVSNDPNHLQIARRLFYSEAETLGSSN